MYITCVTLICIYDNTMNNVCMSTATPEPARAVTVVGLPSSYEALGVIFTSAAYVYIYIYIHIYIYIYALSFSLSLSIYIYIRCIYTWWKRGALGKVVEKGHWCKCTGCTTKKIQLPQHTRAARARKSTKVVSVNIQAVVCVPS